MSQGRDAVDSPARQSEGTRARSGLEKRVALDDVSGLQQRLSETTARRIKELAQSINAGHTNAKTLQAAWETIFSSVPPQPDASDVHALVQWVLREAYPGRDETLQRVSSQVKTNSRAQKAIRVHLDALRRVYAESLRYCEQRGWPAEQLDDAARAELGRHLSQTCETALGALRQQPQLSGEALEVGDSPRSVAVGFSQDGTPALQPSALPALIEHWEAVHADITDRAQRANVHLEQLLHEQQQALQALSTLSTTLYETAMAAARQRSARPRD